MVDAERGAGGPAGQGDLLASQFRTFFQQLVVVVVVDVELGGQQVGCGLHIQQVVDSLREDDVHAFFKAELESQRIVDHLERTLRGLDRALHRGHLHLELVGIGLFRHAHVHGILGDRV